MQQVFKVRWDDALLYHLVINTGKWNMATAVELIVEAAKRIQAVPV